MKKNILFDLDGTIIDPFESITKCAAYALEKLGIPFEDLESLTHFIGPTLFETFTNYYGLTDEEASNGIEYYRERFDVEGVSEGVLYEGMLELLKDLSTCYDLYVATSKPTNAAREVLSNLGADKYFKYIGGSNPEDMYSTKTIVIQDVIKANGLNNPDECIMIGDRSYDIKGASDCKMESIGVKYGYGSEEEFISNNATYIVETVKDLHELLKSI